ncbi:MAG TPA: hypothetical protein VFJ58_15005 [Armatimonadota bacterium]|nr:hypothetical protein [Armatimonadota bacterium]
MKTGLAQGIGTGLSLTAGSFGSAAVALWARKGSQAEWMVLVIAALSLALSAVYRSTGGNEAVRLAMLCLIASAFSVFCFFLVRYFEHPRQSSVSLMYVLISAIVLAVPFKLWRYKVIRARYEERRRSGDRGENPAT